MARLLRSLFAAAMGAIAGTVVVIYPFAFLFQMGADNLQQRLVFALHSALQLGPFIAGATFLGMVVIGLPIQYAMQRQGNTGYWTHANWAAFAGGALPCLTVVGTLFAPFGLVSGFIAGSVFWLIRRPDRDGQAAAK